MRLSAVSTCLPRLVSFSCFPSLLTFWSHHHLDMPNLSPIPQAQDMASGSGDQQQQSPDWPARINDQEPAAAANEIPEQRRGCPVRRDRYLANDLPPLFELEEIFADMASNAQRLGFASVLDALGGRPLRVATMCSGTEAPLLALEMVQSGKFIICPLFASSMRCTSNGV